MAPARIDSVCLFPVWPPKVESVDELDQLLAELARLDRVETRTATALAGKIGALTTEAAADFIVELEGNEEPLAFADWRTKLEAAAKKYADKHRDDILEEGYKSRVLNHGKVGWKESGTSLEPLPDFTDAGNDKILKALLAKLRTTLKEIADFTPDGSRFVECKLTWRKKDLLKGYEDQDVPLTVLKKAGFQVRESTDDFFLKAVAGDVESLPTE